MMTQPTQNLQYRGDPDLQRLCDDAMQIASEPSPMLSRKDRDEIWHRYNERLCRREQSLSYRALKGNL
jgi:hypothetical protein